MNFARALCAQKKDSLPLLTRRSDEALRTAKGRSTIKRFTATAVLVRPPADIILNYGTRLPVWSKVVQFTTRSFIPEENKKGYRE
jgi:hypothetical protein